MKVTVIIPVGPGHEVVAIAAIESVRRAWRAARGPFNTLELAPIADPEGHGRSAARNEGMREHPAHWHFLMDADDTMTVTAFNEVDLNAAATFGAVCLDKRTDSLQKRATSRDNRYPLSREDLFHFGAVGTLSMGCFVRGDLGLRFDETLDVGEDFDFYMRLPSFTKRKDALVCIGYHLPSAGGPRSSADVDWRRACAEVIARYWHLEHSSIQ